MKNFKLIFAMLAIAGSMLAFQSCGGGDEPNGPVEEPVLTVQGTLKFNAEGGTKNVAVTIVPETATFSGATSETWLTVANTDTGLSVTAAAYDNDEEDRTATITVTGSNGKTAEIAVTQSKTEPAPITITLNPTSITFDGIDPQPATITVTTDAPAFTVDPVDPATSFFSFTVSGNTITVNPLGVNMNPDELSGTIMVRADGAASPGVATIMQSAGARASNADFDPTGSWTVTGTDLSDTTSDPTTWAGTFVADAVGGAYMTTNWANMASKTAEGTADVPAVWGSSEWGFSTDETRIIFTITYSGGTASCFVQMMGTEVATGDGYYLNGVYPPVVSVDGTIIAMPGVVELSDGSLFQPQVGVAFYQGTSKYYFGDLTYQDLMWVKTGTRSLYGVNMKTFGNTVFKSTTTKLSSDVVVEKMPANAKVSLR